jgi:repressor LexA
MPEPLEPLEGRVYHYLIDFLAEHSYQPSIREIARKFRIKSTKTVSDLLHALERKGYIERALSRSRGVRLLGVTSQAQTQPVPCYRDVPPAGSPFSSEHRSGFITIDRRFLPAEDVVMIRVGADLPGRGILSGDYVLVSPSTRTGDGALTAVRLTDRAAVGTLTLSDGAFLLRGHEPEPVAITADAVLGTVYGVFRPFIETPQISALPDGDHLPTPGTIQ